MTAKTKKTKRTTKKTAKTKAEPQSKTDRDSKAGAAENAAERLTAADHEKLARYLREVAEHGQGVIQDFVELRAKRGRSRQTFPFDPLNVGKAFIDVLKGMAQEPHKLAEAQARLWRGYFALWENAARRMLGQDLDPVVSPDRNDRRFQHKAWNESHILDFIKQSYLLTSNWMQETVAEVGGLDERTRKKAEFYTKQFADALSPSNFAFTNPEVIEATLETGGENLLRGLKNLLEDLDRGDGTLAIRQTDTKFFKVGENVATTPGKVIYQNEIMQLIQYAPRTEKVHKRPLLIFPPWINKFYILDLREENSFIRWMVEQGHTVFLVSWVNPGPELAERTFADYIKEGVFEALDAIEKQTGEREVDAIGYCIGGTMLATALALMAKRNDNRIKTATFFTTQTDFTEPGELSIFVDEEQLKALDAQMQASGGVLEGTAMANAFNMLRSNDLIWSFVINNYLLGKDPKRFDLLYWNSDATRMPRKVHLFYLREFYLHNSLARGEMEIDGEKLDLSRVKIPVYMQASETDHIAPYASVYRSAKLFGGPTRFMLAGSGHIAGVINHPNANKYHYYTNEKLPDSVEEWKAAAKEKRGSWWPDWMEWLNAQQSGEMVDARDPAAGPLKPIEDAPGSYVKVKSLPDEDT
ncbi:MAG: class I poly(R)-hydroxyalkanoic acid synthase [Parvularculaceae bacterium]